MSRGELVAETCAGIIKPTNEVQVSLAVVMYDGRTPANSVTLCKGEATQENT
jgi:hypothetical protein